MLSDRLDLEAVLPLAEIRSHTRTDDVPTVTDAQLRLYREAAFEACEQFTGRVMRGTRVEIEEIGRSDRDRTRRGTVRVKLRFPPADGFLTFSDGSKSYTATVRPGVRDIEVPVFHSAIDTWACCGGCDTPVNFGMTVTYKTGTCRTDDVPAGVKLGLLKFIAWTIEHPGDALVTVAGIKTEGGALAGTNNGVWGSGAVEAWRQYRLDVAR